MEKKKSRKIKWIVGAIIVIIMGSVLLIKSDALFSKGERRVLASSTLIDIVRQSQLSTASFTYNGVAEAYEKNKIKCHIRYFAKVRAWVELNEIEFDIDDDKLTVRPILPEIQLKVEIDDTRELSFIPKNVSLSLAEALTTCEQDVVKEASESTALLECAEENLKDIIEALIYPVVDSVDYEIVWE